MDITYLGNVSFKVKTKQATVLVNPTTIKNEADIVLFSSKNSKTNLEKVVGVKKAIATPGEFEIAGVSIIAFKDGENVSYVIEAEGLRVLYLSKISKELKAERVDDIGSVDAMMVSVGDEFDSVSKIEPLFILPMNYESDKQLDEFVAKYSYAVEAMPKLSLKKELISEDLNTTIVKLDSK